MQLSTRLDLDLVAVESADQITVLVQLAAPEADLDRSPVTLQVVLDRSGSMAGDRLDGAKAALVALVDRLAPTDVFGVVAFDDQVQIVVPAGPLLERQSVKRQISAVEPGGTTDLSAGYLRGLQEVRRAGGPGGATVLVVSDGHANAGIVDPDALAGVARKASDDRVTTSALGFGLGYDERLLSAIAKGGLGNELFAEEADTAIALISGEVDGLLSQVCQAASLRITPSVAVSHLAVVNDLPAVALPDGVMVELGSFYSAETRRLVVTLDVPGLPALGLTEVAVLELTHVSLPDLVQHVLSVPLHVNVVPGDQAAGRVPDAEVRSEALFQQAQTAKRESSRLLSAGRVAEARDLLQQTSLGLSNAAAAMPAPLAAELRAESALMGSLAAESAFDSSRTAKATSYDAMRKSRNRGRTVTGGALLLVGSGLSMVVEQWQVAGWARDLPADLHALLRPSRTGISAEQARMVAAALPEGHPVQALFAGAATGVSIARA